MSDRIALDLLVDSLRSEVAGLPAALGDGTEQAQFDAMTIARQNKVLGPVHRRLARGRLAPHYLEESAATMAGNSALLAALVEIAPAMRSSGHPFVVIKGPLQQQILYGTFFQRRSADLDILVSPLDFGLFRGLLVAAGYSLATPSMWWRGTLGEEHFYKPESPSVAIDLHHHVQQPGASAPRDFGQYFGPQEVDVRGVKIPTLNARDGMLLCTISIAKALFNREPSGAYLCDLYAGLMAATPRAIDSFLAAARDAGLIGHAQVALRLMSEVFGVEIDHGTGVFAEAIGNDLLRMVFLPRDPTTHWPKRRSMLWELCGRQPARYARELGKVAGSELMRRAFERPGPVQREPSA